MPKLVKKLRDNSILFLLQSEIIAFLLLSLGLIIYYLCYRIQNSDLKLLALEQADSTRLLSELDISCLNKNYWLEILKLVAGAFLTTGFLSLLLELSSIKKLITDSISAFTKSAEFDLKRYSSAELELLSKRVIAYSKEINDISLMDKSVYALNKNYTDLFKSIYYEEHDAAIILTPDSNKAVFRKFMRLTQTIINNYGDIATTQLHTFLQNNDPNFNIEPFKNVEVPKKFEDLKSKKEAEIEIYDNVKLLDHIHKTFNYEFRNLTINGIPILKEEINKHIKIEVNYDRQNKVSSFCMKFERKLCEKVKHKVVFEIEYDLPITDVVHQLYLTRPCQSLNHNITINGKEASEWVINSSAYAPFYYSGSDLEKYLSATDVFPQYSSIMFKEWVLPGSGYDIFLTHLDQSSKKAIIPEDKTPKMDEPSLNASIPDLTLKAENLLKENDSVIK